MGKSDKKDKPPIDIPDGTRLLLEFANLIEGKPGELIPSDEYFKKRKGDVDVDKLDNVWECGYWHKKKGIKRPAIRRQEFSLDKFNEFKKWILKRGIPPYSPSGIIEIRDFPRYICEKNKRLEFLKRKPFKLDLNETKSDDRAASEIYYHLCRIEEILIKIIKVNQNGTEDNFIPFPYVTQDLGYPLWPTVLWGYKKPEFIHDGTLPQAIIAYFLDFYVNQKELHPYLRRCLTCGRFFILQGRERKHCSKKCRITFNERSRSEDAKMKKGRSAEKSKEKKGELEKRLRADGYSEDEVIKEKKRFKNVEQYERHYGL
jgi:hypothetical protein